jgi:hypothetical protein
LQLSVKVTVLLAGNTGMFKPLEVSVLTDKLAGQVAPPLLAQLKLVQLKPALGVSLSKALLAQAGPALPTVMVYCVVLPAIKVLVPLVLLKLKAAGAMMVAVCVEESTEVRVLRRVDVRLALLLTVPVVLALTVLLMVSVMVEDGAILKAGMGKVNTPGQLATQGDVLVALQLTLPSVAPLEIVSATVTLVAVKPALLLLIVTV